MTTGLIVIEPWDQYGSQNDALLIQNSNFAWVQNGSAGLTTGRFGTGQAAILGNNGWVCSLFQNFTTLYKHVAMYIAATAPGVSHTFQWWDLGSVQVALVFNSTNYNITAYRGTTVIATSANNVWANNTWFDFESQVTINSSSGVVNVKLNGVSVISFTGNTQQTSTTHINGFFAGGGGTSAVYWDDLVVRDDQWVGLVKLPAVFATANYGSEQWTPSTGSNYSNINGLTQSTKYNYTATVNNIDLFTFGALTNITSIQGVGAFIEFWKDDAGTSSVAIEINADSATAYGATRAATSTPSIGFDAFNLDPAGNAWTQILFNGGNYGYKKIA